MAPSVIVQNGRSELGGILLKKSLLSQVGPRSDPRGRLAPPAGPLVTPEKQQQYRRAVVQEALHHEVSKINVEKCLEGEEDPFYVADLGVVYRQFLRWRDQLPMVKPYYAVKCNPDIGVLSTLAKLGCNFDCASVKEIRSVLELGVSPDRVIYANPCKTSSYLRFAQQSDVGLTTVDNAAELYKIQKYHPGCGILIRIITDDSAAVCRLSTKFGCTVDTATNELLPLAAKLGLNVRGVAFHIGSGAEDFSSIHRAIGDARKVFDVGISKHGFRGAMNILDIGGGFQSDTFDEAAAIVRESLATYFPQEYAAEHGVQFIAEPGRFMVSGAFTLVTHVIARRDAPHGLPDDTPKAMIYINDGVYGNLNCILFDHQLPQPSVLSHKGKLLPYSPEGSDPQSSPHTYSIWGPTCDGLDCVSPRSSLTHDVDVGDWLYFPNLGAYTLAAATSFNGFKCAARIVYVASEDLSQYNI